MTRQDQRRLIGKVIEIATQTVMRSHVYQFEGESRLQQKGGSIGLAVTGVLARIRMNVWAREFRRLCEENNQVEKLLKTYVDDVNSLWKLMRKGTQWTGDKLERREEWFQEDMRSKEAGDRRMMRELKAMASSVRKDISLTIDTPSMNEDGRLPVLDLKMWLEERVTAEGREKYKEIVHVHYEKPMVSPLVIMKESALPEKMKRQVLAQEVIRICKNTSECVNDDEKKEQMKKIAKKMKLSGYSEGEGGKSWWQE